MKALSGLTEGQLTRPAGTEDRPGEVRLHLIGLAGADDVRRTTLGAIFAALGWQQTEAQRILASAAEARGLLQASLIGLTEADLDTPPAAEEWAVRQVLGHVLNVEQRYCLQTAYAAERSRDPSLPPQMPEDRMPPRFPDSALAGGVEAILSQLAATREQMVVALAGLGSAELMAPAAWARWSVDVRFRLYRFAAHDREHLAQILKTLTAIGGHQSEAQILLGQAEIARGALEGMLIGLPDELAARKPGDGSPSVLELLQQAPADEGAAVAGIAKALE
jgi:hypothetical protein